MTAALNSEVLPAGEEDSYKLSDIADYGPGVNGFWTLESLERLVRDGVRPNLALLTIRFTVPGRAIGLSGKLAGQAIRVQFTCSAASPACAWWSMPRPGG